MKDLIITEIEAFNREIFAAGRGKLTATEDQLFSLLLVLESHLSKGETPPPLLILEIFLVNQNIGRPPFQFTLSWLYSGLLEFHKSAGKIRIENALGLKHKTRSTPFTKAAKETEDNAIAFKMRFLCKVGDLTVAYAASKIMEMTIAKSYEQLRDIYYEHRNQFDAWDVAFEEMGAEWCNQKLSAWGVNRPE